MRLLLRELGAGDALERQRERRAAEQPQLQEVAAAEIHVDLRLPFVSGELIGTMVADRRPPGERESSNDEAPKVHRLRVFAEQNLHHGRSVG